MKQLIRKECRQCDREYPPGYGDTCPGCGSPLHYIWGEVEIETKGE